MKTFLQSSFNQKAGVSRISQGVEQGISRRQALKYAGVGLTGLGISTELQTLLAAEPKPAFRIGACDWSIGKRQQLGAFELAKRIGLDGIQASFDEVGAEYDLRQASVRKQFAEAVKATKVKIASLAMGILNRRPYSSDEQSERWVEDCIEVMRQMGQKVVLLAFFGRGDIKNKPELQQEVIRRLKKVAPKAEKAGVTLGIESWLSAEEHMRIIDAVGSPAVKVYYDVANSHKMGYDIYQEILQLGRRNICEFHCKENGFLLGQGKVDFKRLKQVIDDIGYTGWLIIESAVGKDMSTFDSYVYNQKYLRSIFG
jgi:L-ribulose-5-phosphate 3-epimerase